MCLGVGCQAEVGADAVGVVCVRGHGHDAAYVCGAQAFVGLTAEKFYQFVGGEAEFGLLGGHVELEEHTAHYAGARRFVVDEAQETLGIDALNQGHLTRLDEAAHLVGLQVADEVPADVGREFLHLGLEFLSAAFAEEALPGVVSLADGFGRVEFAHGDQLHSLGESGAYIVESSGDGSHQSTTFIL